MNRILLLFGLAWVACQSPSSQEPAATDRIKPVVITEAVNYDSDDPAIWINPDNPAQSLVLGTDKGGDAGKGALFVFTLDGKILPDKTIEGLQRPNNVDITYGISVGSRPKDIAVLTERYSNRLRVFSLPDMQPLDGGGIPVFEGETNREPMGIALYRRPADGTVYAFVSRKTGPSGSYLWQYALEDNGQGQIRGRHIRSLGLFEGGKEIEAIAVDQALGYVYYSDETMGVRKYYADPDSTNRELAVLATQGFAEDHEGISIYPASDTTGYLIVSDQQANLFRVFPREGTARDPHEHPQLATLALSTQESDGHDVTARPVSTNFPQGFLVAMSDDGTFQLYDMQILLEQITRSSEPIATTR